jgi:site-specific DNA-methyltransferase (adenine-specific)
MAQTATHITERNSVVAGDALEVLRRLPDGLADVVITSPPYFQQRDYGNGALGIGNELTEEGYLASLLQIFGECVRVTKDTGALVFNLGDKYLDGSLSLLPYKFAIKALEQHRLFLINQLTWVKLNPTPRQEKRKLIQSTEPFFIFTKSKDYHFDLDNYLSHLDLLNRSGNGKPTGQLGKKYFALIEQADLSDDEKQQARAALHEAIQSIHRGEMAGFRMKIRGLHKLAYGGQDGGRNNQIINNGFTIIKITGQRMKKDIIESPVEITKDNLHPAVYPSYIVQELVKLLSKEGDLILDPFCGSGTTCVVAKALKREYLGIEINPQYVALANKRLKEDKHQLELFI